MKKIILLFILISGLAFSQENLTYSLKIQPDRLLVLYPEITKKGKVSVNIDVPPKENLYTSKIQISLKNETQIANLRSALKLVRDKYAEWSKIADENDTKDFIKSIVFDNERGIYLDVNFADSKWHIASATFVEFSFLRDNGNNYLRMSNLLDLSDLYNRFITNKGFSVVFSDVSEVQTFIDNLNLEKLKEFGEKSKNTDELFK